MEELLDFEALQQAIDREIASLEGKSVRELLAYFNILPQLTRNAAIATCISDVAFSQEEYAMVNQYLYQGNQPPVDLAIVDIDTAINSAPEELRSTLNSRLKEMQFQKFVESRYTDLLGPYFMERQASLEKIVYAVIRLEEAGVADELYMRLVDGDEEFGEIAKNYSIGDERLTRGLVGPIYINQINPVIQEVLTKLSPGENHSPIRIDKWSIILQLEHRQPARLDDQTKRMLMNELFEKDLNLRLEDFTSKALAVSP